MQLKTISHVEVAQALVHQNKERPRINLHNDPSDPVQKMIYMQRKGEHKPPHRNSRELTKIILCGKSELVTYDDDCNVTSRTIIYPDGIFCYTLAPMVWHSNFNLTDEVTFFEVMNGPYPKNDVEVWERAYA